jgi:hypothetical protein
MLCAVCHVCTLCPRVLAARSSARASALARAWYAQKKKPSLAAFGFGGKWGYKPPPAGSSSDDKSISKDLSNLDLSDTAN